MNETNLDGASHLAGHGAWAHDFGSLDDVLPGQVAVVLDVLDLLAVTGRLLQGADEQGGGRRNDGHGGLAVLDGELDSHLQTTPVRSALGNIITNLLGGLHGKYSWARLASGREKGKVKTDKQGVLKNRVRPYACKCTA